METFWYKLRLSKAWNHKAPFILSAIYLVILKSELNLEITYLFLSFCTILGIAGIGYLLNDLGDRESDRRAGKPNFFNDHTLMTVWALFPFLIGFAFVPWFFFPADKLSWFLLAAEIMTFIIYALPPFRLKHKVFLAPIFDALYAHIIPGVLAAHTFMLLANAQDLWLLLLLGLWQLMYGIRSFINHLFIDRGNDLFNYRTIATVYNAHTWRSILLVGAVLEFLVFLTLAFVYLGPWVLGAIVIITLIYSNNNSGTYSYSTSSIDRLYVTFWPLICLVLLCYYDNHYWWVLLIHLILFSGLYENRMTDRLILQFRSAASSIVNYTLYYFRKFILWQSEKNARKQYYDQYLIDKSNRIKMKEKGTITLVNLHKNKYSETFIHHYKTELPYAVDFLHGGYPPTLDENNNSLGNESAILKRLVDTRSRMILAHFGPMGVSMMPYARSAGIPLVVYFHAYDVHHIHQLENYKDRYLELFEFAHLLLASSQEIAQKLKELGAPDVKVKYLPAYLPTEEFLNLSRSPEPDQILAVGRFTDTKSPHILLLAFQRVCEEIPSARLTLIGEGELLESSIMLAKALKIGEKVSFLGKQSPEEVKRHLKRAMLFVQHSATTPLSQDKEGTPVAIMEALAAGLPVISTNHAGIAELIDHRKTGLLVEELDYEAMAIEIIKCLKSPEYCDQIGVEAKKSIKRNSLIMDHTKIITKIIEDYGLSI